jgi:hypothetical protein
MVSHMVSMQWHGAWTCTGQMGQCFSIKCTAYSSKQENTGPQWAYELHSASATAENWHLKGHMLKVNYIRENTCTFFT